jgi:hypothetical protein
MPTEDDMSFSKGDYSGNIIVIEEEEKVVQKLPSIRIRRQSVHLAHSQFSEANPDIINCNMSKLELGIFRILDKQLREAGHPL